MVNFAIAVKAFIVDDKKRILLIKRELNDVHRPGIWEIPGGRLDSGEDPVEGLKRETKEETGLNIDVLNPLGVRHFTREDGQSITMIIFLCKAESNNVKLSEEHIEYDWVELNKKDPKLADFFNEEVELYKKKFMD
jgi:8-oxo-dGTP diphosphatase